MTAFDEPAVVHYAGQTMNHMNALLARKLQCYHDSRGVQHCKQESFFHRLGRWILMAVMLFFGLILLMVVCCCIRRSRKKRAAAVPMQQVYATPQASYPYANNPPPPPQQGGIMGRVMRMVRR